MRKKWKSICGLLALAGLSAFVLVAWAANSWNSAGSMHNARAAHTATLLPSGQVLVVGGSSGALGSRSTLANVEFYNPTNNAWTTGTASMQNKRTGHSATLLQSGKVLVSGGTDLESVGGHTAQSPPYSTAELYDPVNNSWTYTGGSMTTGRDSHTATLLPSGKVLVAGGEDASFGSIASAEIYDPTADQWSVAASMATAREYHTATLLPSGSVLVVGGMDVNGNSLASVEIYNPARNSWTAAASLNQSRASHTATLLSSGKVLVAGGTSGIQGSVEVYDPAQNTWTLSGNLAVYRQSHTASLLSSGMILIAGGYGVSSVLSSTELYDPVAGSSVLGGSLVAARAAHTATVLPSGQVLAAGGFADESTATAIASAELYMPAIVAPTKLVISSINSGSNPVAGTGFPVVIQAQDASGIARNVAADTGVGIELVNGTGSLGGSLICTIPAGSSSCTLNAVTYSVAESGVILRTVPGIGSGLVSTNSASFTVNAAAVTTFTGTTSSGGSATASFTGGGAACTFQSSQFVDVSSVPAAPPAGATFPQGLFRFTTTACDTGSTITLTLTYSQPLPAGSVYYKYGSTSAIPTAHWYQYPATINGNTVVLNITDGGAGDDDLKPNGSMSDPGGPALPAASPPPTATTVSAPALSDEALIALALCLGLWGTLNTMVLRGYSRRRKAR